MKRLYRARNNQMLGGVCMGLARYFDVDVTLVRLIWVLGGLMGGFGLPAYIIAWVIIPEEPAEGEAIDITPGSQSGLNPDTRTVGLVIIAIGVYLLLRNLLPHLFLRAYLWPIVLVALGLVIIFGGMRGDKQ